MKYSIDRNTNSNNVVVLSETALIIGSCDKEQISSVEQQLSAGKSAIEVLGTEDIKSIPYTQIQGLTHLSTDNNIDVRHKQSKAIETITLYFKNKEEAAEIANSVGQFLPDNLEKKVTTPSALSSVLMSIVSLIVCAAVCFLFYNKFRIAVYIVGGLWALASLYNAYDRFTNPPVVTRWNIKGKYTRKAWAGLKTAGSYAFLGIFAFGLSTQFPDRYGTESLYQSAYNETIQPEDVKKYLARGADIDFTNVDGDTALDMALYAEDNDLSLAIIEAGANVSRTDYSILSTALYYGADARVIGALLDRGALEAAEINGFDVSGYIEDYDDQEFSELLNQHRKVIQAEQY